MRIDVASIDMVSEVNMVSVLRRCDKPRPRVLCVSLAVTSPLAPGGPARRAPLTRRHAQPAALWFVFWTHARTTAVFRRKRARLYFGKDG